MARFFERVKSAASSLRSLGSSKHHHEYKMLLIGETGSGKTSFLNLLCNSAVIQKLGFEQGLKSNELGRFNDIELENAEARKMESKTLGTKLYNVKLGDLNIGIIDTPGFGDSRGMEEDKKHSQTIVDALKAEEYINCICLVINGRMARMTATLRYVLTEVTAILPRVVLNNVIVVSTNTRDLLDCNFDREALKEFFGREIEEERVFFIENPCCRLEKAKEEKTKGKSKEVRLFTDDKIVQSLKTSFDETASTLTGMCTLIKDFGRVHTHHFTELYETKQEIERKVLKLLTEYDNQTELEKEIAVAGERVRAALRSKQLHADYKSTQTIKRWNQFQTSRHNTLCGAKGCYSNCHTPCHLDKAFDKEVFRKCKSMGRGTECIICGHSYMDHYHDEIEHVLEEEQVEMIDKPTKKLFEEAKSMAERARIFVDSLNEKQKISERTRRTLSDQLVLTIEDFQKLGVNRNYIKVLENQLVLVNHRLEGETGDMAEHLRKMKEKIEKELKVVKAAIDEPFSQHADPEVSRDWACKVLDVSPSSNKHTIEKSYKKLSKVAHPDRKGGDSDHFKRIGRARDIFLGRK